MTTSSALCVPVQTLKGFHRELPAAMRKLMRMMQADFEEVRIQIVEVDKYVEVRTDVYITIPMSSLFGDD